MNHSFLDDARSLADVQVYDPNQAESWYGADTGGSLTGFGGAVCPASATQVEALIAAANRHGVALWPISGGRNFGYGTARPALEGTVILDLSRLRGIRIDIACGTAEIEPGVTQADLEAAIADAGAELLVPTTGVGPNGNLLGNALDGGYGLTPIADHFSAIAAMEGYWGDGTPFRHIYADLGCGEMSTRWNWGTGPYWSGLLRQGGYGVVTRATLQLARIPEAVRILVLEWPDSASFCADQPAFARLVEDIPGIGGVIAMNDYRILSTHPDAPLAEAVEGAERMAYLNRLARERRVSRWTAVGTLYGSERVVAGAVSDLRRRLGGCHVRAFTPTQVFWLQRVFAVLPEAWFPALRRHLGSLVNAVGTVRGKPIVAFLRIAYALERQSPPLGAASHPARDGCGILWYAPLLPFQAEAVARYERVMTEILLRHGFDPLLALTTRSTRLLSATIPLIFVRDDPAAVARAKACYEDLVRSGLREGWPPYRIGTDFMALVYPPAGSPNERLQRKLKQALDPRGVVSPGRYTRPEAEAA